MADRIVINTGPLIAFARADSLDVLRQLPIQFVCPSEVEEEIRAGAALGHSVVIPPWLTVVAAGKPLDPVALAALDPGEAAVIHIALEQGIRRVCMDDRKGRRAALAVGLEIVGSLGLLARAKQLGIISAVRPLVDRLSSEGAWYDPELLRRFFQAIGE
jgi:uncharacterized protein